MFRYLYCIHMYTHKHTKYRLINSWAFFKGFHVPLWISVVIYYRHLDNGILWGTKFFAHDVETSYPCHPACAWIPPKMRIPLYEITLNDIWQTLNSKKLFLEVIWKKSRESKKPLLPKFLWLLTKVMWMKDNKVKKLISRKISKVKNIILEQEKPAQQHKIFTAQKSRS